MAAASAHAATPEFTDWTAQTGTVMNGTLLGGSVALDGPFQPGSVFDQTFTGFNDARWTPALASTDVVVPDSSPGAKYTLNFGAAVQDPVFHWYSLASIITFPSGVTVKKVSGEPTLTVSGNTVTGQAAGSTDSNGTIQVLGTYTSLPFNADPNFVSSNPVDGIFVQIGGTTPPAGAPPPSNPPPPPDTTPASPPPDSTQPTQPGQTTQLPPPSESQTVNTEVAQGTILVKLPGEKSFHPVLEGAQIPVGTVVDARNGTARITVAIDAKGHTQTGTFYGGIFQVLQRAVAAGLPVTELVLTGGSFRGCPRARSKRPRAARSAAQSHKVVRHLWGQATGRFRTRGRYASATVRGTTWLTADRCDGTLIRVKRGLVAVQDFTPIGHPPVLRAGQSYLATPDRRR